MVEQPSMLLAVYDGFATGSPATGFAWGDSRLRITIVQGPFLPVPPLMGGAVERTMETLGRAWAAAGCEVTHVSRRWGELPAEEIRDGVRHLRVASANAPRSRLRFRLRELAYCRRVLRVLPPGDVVVINSVLLPLLLRRSPAGRPVVRVERPPKGQLRFYRRAALVQTVSHDMERRILAEAPWLAGRVSNVGLPLAGAFAPLTPGAAEGGRERLVTFAGRLHPEKGVELLIQAFVALAAESPAWRLQIIGPHSVSAGGGGEAYRQRLETLAAALPGRIALRPPLFEEAALAGEMRRSEIFVYPSLAERGEALGLAPLEAAGQGAVPLVSALACFRDFVTPDESGSVFDHRAPDPAATLAAALRRLIADDGLRARLRAGALAAASRYEAGAVAERHLADFRRLLEA